MRSNVFPGLIGLLLLTACTTVHVHNTDGKVDVSSHFGIVYINVQPGEHVVIIDTRALGLSRAARTFNVGYLGEKIVLAEDDCRLILFEPKTEQVEKLVEMLKGQDSLCILGKGGRVR
jgi:hypothetical protein